jgi:hypothetical protein
MDTIIDVIQAPKPIFPYELLSFICDSLTPTTNNPTPVAIKQ